MKNEEVNELLQIYNTFLKSKNSYENVVYKEIYKAIMILSKLKKIENDLLIKILISFYERLYRYNIESNIHHECLEMIDERIHKLKDENVKLLYKKFEMKMRNKNISVKNNNNRIDKDKIVKNNENNIATISNEQCMYINNKQENKQFDYYNNNKQVICNANNNETENTCNDNKQICCDSNTLADNYDKVVFSCYYFSFLDDLYEKEKLLLKIMRQEQSTENYVACNCNTEKDSINTHKNLYVCFINALELHVDGKYEDTKALIRKCIAKCHRICFELSLFLYFYLIQSHILLAEFLEARYYIKKIIQIIVNSTNDAEICKNNTKLKYVTFYSTLEYFLVSLTSYVSIAMFLENNVIDTQKTCTYKTCNSLDKEKRLSKYYKDELLTYFRKYYGVVFSMQHFRNKNTLYDMELNENVKECIAIKNVEHCTEIHNNDNKLIDMVLYENVKECIANNNTKLYTNILYNTDTTIDREVRIFDLPNKYKNIIKKSTSNIIDVCLGKYKNYTFLSFYVCNNKLTINIYNYSDNNSDNCFCNDPCTNCNADQKCYSMNKTKYNICKEDMQDKHCCIGSFNIAYKYTSKTISTEINWCATKISFDDLIAKSKDTMLRNVRTNKDKILWWKDRHAIDKKMNELCQKISKNIENAINNSNRENKTEPPMNTIENKPTCCYCNTVHPNKKNMKSKQKQDKCDVENTHKIDVPTETTNCLSKNMQNSECNTNKTTKAEIKNNVFIITDEITTNFPYEMLNILKNNVCYRIQSFEWLYTKIMSNTKSQSCDSIEKSIFYLIDPENNLESTKNTIQKLFTDYAIHCKKDGTVTSNDKKRIYECEGVVGRSLDDEEKEKAYNKQYFMYFGDGNGEKFISKERLKYIKNDAIFLFGCSSSKTSSHKNFKRNALCLEYMKKSNNLIGCLWDVTDKDLDKFSGGLGSQPPSGDSWATLD
ncbi:separin protein [Binucleata daphniae]